MSSVLTRVITERLLKFGTIVLTVCLVACSPSVEQRNAGLVVADAYFRSPLPGSTMSSAYMKVSNHSPEAISLVGFTAEGVGRVELHNHTHEDGMMKMREVETIKIQPGDELVLEPGGYHLMLFDIADRVRELSSLHIELYSDAGEPLAISATASR